MRVSTLGNAQHQNDSNFITSKSQNYLSDVHSIKRPKSNQPVCTSKSLSWDIAAKVPVNAFLQAGEDLGTQRHTVTTFRWAVVQLGSLWFVHPDCHSMVYERNRKYTCHTSRRVVYRTHVSMIGFSDHRFCPTNHIVFGLFNIKACIFFVEILGLLQKLTGGPVFSSLLLHEVGCSELAQIVVR